MPSHRLIRLFLLIGSLAAVGCGRDPKVDPKAEVAAMATAIASTGQIEDCLQKLTDKTAVILVDGIEDINHWKEIRKNLDKLVDPTADDGSVMATVGYTDTNDDMYAEVAPVTDVEAVARRIDFGTVLAVDVEKRIVLVRAGTGTVAAQPRKWEGGEKITQYIQSKKIAWCQKLTDKKLVEKFGREQVVVVNFSGSTTTTWVEPIIKKLKKMVEPLHGQARDSYTDYGPHHENQVVVTLAPVRDMQKAASEFDWGEVVAVDLERRVILMEVRSKQGAK